MAALSGVLLLLICFLVDTVQTYSPGIQRAKNIIERKLHKTETTAEKIINDSNLIKVSADYTAAKEIIDELKEDKNIQLYIYNDDLLTYWSTNSFIPENIDKLSEHEIHFLKEGNGFYEVIHNESKGESLRFGSGVFSVCYQ